MFLKRFTVWSVSEGKTTCWWQIVILSKSTVGLLKNTNQGKDLCFLNTYQFWIFWNIFITHFQPFWSTGSSCTLQKSLCPQCCVNFPHDIENGIKYQCFSRYFQYWEHQGGHKKMSKALIIPHLGQWQNNSTCSSISSSMRRPLMMEPMRSQPQLIKLPNCLKAAALWLKQLNVGEHLHNIWTHVCLEEFMVWWDQNLAFCS